jgi:hypothetical protein
MDERFSALIQVPAPSNAERVIGTHLLPHRLFRELHPVETDFYSLAEVVATAQVNGREVLVTRNAGLFVRILGHFSDPISEPSSPRDDFDDKLAFEIKTAASFNRLICELGLCSIVPEPATPVHISAGRLIDGHAASTQASGGREMYSERTMQPFSTLLQSNLHALLQLPRTSPEILRRSCSLERANLLAEISPQLPAFVAGAYSLFSRHQLGASEVCSRISKTSRRPSIGRCSASSLLAKGA